MTRRIVPMIHVPDVHATAAWYEAIGFTLAGWHACDADSISPAPLPPGGSELDWALLELDGCEIMLNAGGLPSARPRREVDLYVQISPSPGTENVDALHERLKHNVEVVQAPYDAFHGNRELIIRDLNGFWITFAQPAS